MTSGRGIVAALLAACLAAPLFAVAVAAAKLIEPIIWAHNTTAFR